jgi:hypothetical protein
MTNTQADLTERSRALYETVICENIRLPITAATIIIPALVAFAQSEREAAAAEALHDAADELEGFAEHQESAFEKGAVINCAKMLRRLASPPAPQEETR